MNLENDYDGDNFRISQSKVIKRLVCNLITYENLGPNDKEFFAQAEKKIDKLIGLASEYLGEYEMGELLSMYNYPRNIEEELKETNLTEEALYLCLN